MKVRDWMYGVLSLLCISFVRCNLAQQDGNECYLVPTGGLRSDDLSIIDPSETDIYILEEEKQICADGKVSLPKGLGKDGNKLKVEVEVLLLKDKKQTTVFVHTICDLCEHLALRGTEEDKIYEELDFLDIPNCPIGPTNFTVNDLRIRTDDKQDLMQVSNQGDYVICMKIFATGPNTPSNGCERVEGELLVTVRFMVSIQC